MKLHISESEKKIVLEAIRKYFPQAKISFFGSRVHGHHKEYSDLDVCVDDSKPLDLNKFSLLQEDLSNSNVPYQIDIVDWNRITSDFQKVIQASGSIPAT